MNKLCEIHIQIDRKVKFFYSFLSTVKNFKKYQVHLRNGLWKKTKKHLRKSEHEIRIGEYFFCMWTNVRKVIYKKNPLDTFGKYGWKIGTKYNSGIKPRKETMYKKYLIFVKINFFRPKFKRFLHKWSKKISLAIWAKKWASLKNSINSCIWAD